MLRALDDVKQVADAHRTEHCIVFALVIGLAWADQPKAVKAVLGLGGYDGDGVAGGWLATMGPLG
jgi:hypothetical protein